MCIEIFFGILVLYRKDIFLKGDSGCVLANQNLECIRCAPAYAWNDVTYECLKCDEEDGWTLNPKKFECQRDCKVFKEKSGFCKECREPDHFWN